VHALTDIDAGVRQMAAESILNLLDQEADLGNLRHTSRQLWWRLTDVDRVADAAYEALERAVARLTELEVEALDGEPDPFTPVPAKTRPSTTVLVVLGILVAFVLGMASDPIR